tara:strand:- start:4471 stop:6969 length:2499 start_codon:yes stop_codon:yes gene_type:complete
MTSSFQSTAFQSSARPVDTFVAEPSVLPKSNLMELAETLQTINPALQKFIGQKIEDRIDKEKTKFQNLAIQEDLINGVFGNTVTGVRKELGSDAADQLIGASRHGKKAYAKQKLINSTFQIDNLLQLRYKTDTVDIENEDGSITSTPLNQVSPDSAEFKNWFQGVINPVVTNISAESDPEIINEFVLPQLQKSITNLDTEARKQFNTFNKNRLLQESTNTINTAAKFFIKAQTYNFKNPETKKAMEDDLKNNLSNLIINMKNAGITGSDLTALNENIIDNIVNIGDLSVTQGQFNYARKLVNFLGDSIPGSAPGKTLRDNPKWLEKTTDFFTDLYEKEVENTLRPEKLRKAKRTNDFNTQIEDYRNETNPTLKSQKYEKLKLDFPEKEFQTDIDEFGVLDNKTFTEKANEFKKQLRRGQYLVDGEPDKGSAFLQLDVIERLDPTPDSESQAVVKDLETRIKEMKGYAKDIEKFETKIMNDAKSALSRKNRFAGRSLSNKDAKLLQRYERILQDEADERMDEFEEENKRPMTLREAKEMYRDLDNLLKLELGVFTEKEAGVEYIPEDDAIGKPGQIVNPFSAADRKKNPIEKSSQPQNQQTNEVLQDNSFDVPQLKSEVTNNQNTNQLANNISTGLGNLIQNTSEIVSDISTGLGVTDGDMLAMADTSAQENIEEPEINFSDDTRVQSIVKAAKELGISPIALAAVIAQESSFRPSVVSVDKATGKKYTGLIQFGPYEIEKYNIKENMTFEEQMVAVTSFLKDRGVQPGHGAKEIYAAIFTGNVSNLDKGGADWPDSNGTTVNKALPNLLSGGSKYKMAVDFLQQIGIYQQKS